MQLAEKPGLCTAYCLQLSKILDPSEEDTTIFDTGKHRLAIAANYVADSSAFGKIVALKGEQRVRVQDPRMGNTRYWVTKNSTGELRLHYTVGSLPSLK